MKRAFPAVLVLAVAVAYGYLRPNAPAAESRAAVATAGDSVLASAFRNRSSNIQVQGNGTVAKMLTDDNEGSPHQRFIIRLGSGQTVLVSHNINLAPRVSGLREGDTVSFNGEYEWNDKGGVVHWTHGDPSGRHTPSWIKHNGRTFQ